mmetsp:Transcript_28066/g.53114  ORF Transcript_28066/g.53114 Transcript_28066/m.53114 type:complete len:422 (-) Transcript_28066:189-1454(-)
MPPKKEGDNHGTDASSIEAQQAQHTSARLLDKALNSGIITRGRPQVESVLQPSKVIVACNDKDIVKRGTARKNRYLFALPAVLAPAAAGTLGSVEQMDTRNPVLYVDFPQGRIKFLGTIVHPTNKYLTLSFSTTRKGGVACEDCFDNLVVFSDWYWVGKKSINPEERRLPLPMEMRDIKVHTNPNFQAGAIAVGEDVKMTKALTAAPAEEAELESDEESPDEAMDDVVEPKSEPSRRSGRAVTVVQKSYADGDSESDDDEDDETPLAKRAKNLPRAVIPSLESDSDRIEDDIKPTPKKMPKSLPKATPTKRGTGGRSADVVNLLSDEDNATPAVKSVARSSRRSSVGTGNKATIELKEDSSQDDDGLQATPRNAGRSKSSGVHKSTSRSVKPSSKKKKHEWETDEDEESEEDDDSDFNLLE